MMTNSQNSRRNFLSSLAILTAGSALAGSPAALFNNESSVANPEQTWKDFTRTFQGKGNLFTPTVQPAALSTVPGCFVVKQGKVQLLETENLLVLPNWIYLQGKENKAVDLLVDVFENKAPFKRLKSLNRFELEALTKLSLKSTEQSLVLASCNRSHKGVRGLNVKITTRIVKNSQVSVTNLYNNNSLIQKEKFFLNA